MYKIVFSTQFNAVIVASKTRESIIRTIEDFQKAVSDLDKERIINPLADKLFFIEDEYGVKFAMVRIGAVIGYYVLETDESESWKR